MSRTKPHGRRERVSRRARATRAAAPRAPGRGARPRPSRRGSAPPRCASSPQAGRPGRSRTRRRRAARRAMRPGHTPRTTVSPAPDTSAHAETNAAPRRSSGTSRSCASSSAVFAASSPWTPDHRADSTPGMPFSASTSSPESSATDGSPVATNASRALASAFSSNVAPVSGASSNGGDVVQRQQRQPTPARRRAPGAVRPASCGCGWPPAAGIASASERLLRRRRRLGQHSGVRQLQRLGAASRTAARRRPSPRRASCPASSAGTSRPHRCPGSRRECRCRWRRRSCPPRRAQSSV